MVDIVQKRSTGLGKYNDQSYECQSNEKMWVYINEYVMLLELNLNELRYGALTLSTFVNSPLNVSTLNILFSDDDIACLPALRIFIFLGIATSKSNQKQSVVKVSLNKKTSFIYTLCYILVIMLINNAYTWILCPYWWRRIGQTSLSALQKLIYWFWA